MSFSCTTTDIDIISKTLNSAPKAFTKSWSWRVENAQTKQSLVLSIYNDVKLSESIEGSLISVQSQHGYFELHNCTGYLVFEPDEIIFVQAEESNVSCLIIGKGATCSLFANINRDNINADFSSLEPAVLLSAMQLSIIEGIL